MDENSIPKGDEQELQAGNDQLPEETQTPTAESTETTEENGASQGEPSKDDSSSDVAGSDDLSVWADKQGIDLDNPTPEQAKTLAKRLRDTQASLHEKSKSAKEAQELRKAQEDIYAPSKDDDQLSDEELREIQRDREIASIRASQRTRDFYDLHPEAREYDGEMAKLVAEESKRNGEAAARFLASDLERLYVLAKYSARDDESARIADQAKREERERIRKAQEAAGEQSHATRATSSSKITREWIANEYDSDNPEHVKLLDEAMARGELY